MEKAADLYVAGNRTGSGSGRFATPMRSSPFTTCGQADSAAAILGRFTEAYPNHPQAIQYSAALASAGFEYEEAEDLAQRLLERARGKTPGWKMWGEGELASYAMVQGRVTEGAARILKAYEMQEDVGTRFTEISRPIFEALGSATVRIHFFQATRRGPLLYPGSGSRMTPGWGVIRLTEMAMARGFGPLCSGGKTRARPGDPLRIPEQSVCRGPG